MTNKERHTERKLEGQTDRGGRVLTGMQRHIDKQRQTHREKARTTDRQGW